MIKIMMEYNHIKEIVTGAPNDTQHQNNAHPKTSPIDCEKVTNNMLLVPLENIYNHIMYHSLGKKGISNLLARTHRFSLEQPH